MQVAIHDKPTHLDISGIKSIIRKRIILSYLVLFAFTSLMGERHETNFGGLRNWGNGKWQRNISTIEKETRLLWNCFTF